MMTLSSVMLLLTMQYVLAAMVVVAMVAASKEMLKPDELRDSSKTGAIKREAFKQ